MLVDSLEDIPRRYPDIDLGLIHTGGTTFLVTVVTMTGEHGVRAVEITKPRTAIQEGRPDLDSEHGVRLPRSWRYLQIHAQRMRIALLDDRFLLKR